MHLCEAEASLPSPRAHHINLLVSMALIPSIHPSVPIPAGNGCSLSYPVCGTGVKCDLSAANATAPAGTCRANFGCPGGCAAGFECVTSPLGGLPWCAKRTTCEPACASDEVCHTSPGAYYMPPYVSAHVLHACVGGRARHAHAHSC